MQDEININGVVYIRKDLGSEPKLLPFDIDVVTRHGDEIIIYDYDLKGEGGYIVLGKVVSEDGTESEATWTRDGNYLKTRETYKDLLLLNPKGQ